MIKTINEDKKNRIFLFWAVALYLGYDFSILFKDIIGNTISVSFGFIAFVAYLLLSFIYLHLNSIEALIILFPLCINSSYVNVFGMDYSSAPITWFFLICLFLIIASVFKRRFWLVGLLTFMMFFIYFLIMLIIRSNSDIRNSINQFINISLYILIVSVFPTLYTLWSKRTEVLVTKTYIYAVLSYSLMVVIQAALYNSLSIRIGNIMSVYMRTSFGATMGDYSFSTLYIASGIILLISQIFSKSKSFNRTQIVFFMVLFFSALITVNARTGLFALAVAVAVFMAIMIIREKKYSMLVICVLLVPVFIYAFMTMAGNRMSQSLLDGSNRIEGYLNGLKVFWSNPIVGLGFGTQNFKNATGQALPHNLIIQFLAQFGLVGFGLLLMTFIPIILKIISNNNNGFKWAFFTVIIGAMFIPDIISSHFLSVVTVCALCSSMNGSVEQEGIINE